MKTPQLVKVADLIVEKKMKAIDLLVEQMIEPLSDVGNPEKLIKKPYEQWTPEDLQRLTMIYGTKEPNTLSNFIFNREFEKVKQLESEEIGG